MIVIGVLYYDTESFISHTLFFVFPPFFLRGTILFDPSSLCRVNSVIDFWNVLRRTLPEARVPKKKETITKRSEILACSTTT